MIFDDTRVILPRLSIFGYTQLLPGYRHPRRLGIIPRDGFYIRRLGGLPNQLIVKQALDSRRRAFSGLLALTLTCRFDSLLAREMDWKELALLDEKEGDAAIFGCWVLSLLRPIIGGAPHPGVCSHLAEP